MGIEFELKYSATPECQQAIREEYLGAWQRISMETTYYDTPTADLAALRYTLRRRFENGVSVCTVKTPAGAIGRGEWEVNCDTIEEAIEKLCKLGAPENLIDLTRKGLKPVCGARFTRQALTVEIPGGTAELALDKGILFAADREIPICEVEVELKDGSVEEVALFAGLLAQKYGLQPEKKSKFQRAKALGEE
jgi:inorganic triphosphatase YgiF